jgi:hypothetical protein
MANTVLLKRSSVAGKVPQTTDLVYGELSINYADGVLWYKKSDNTVNPLNSVVYGATVNALTYTNASNVLVNSSALTFNPSGNILTVSGNVTAANVSTAGTIRAAGTLGQSAFISAGANQRGGVGYHGFLEATNTAAGATAPNKYFRLDSAGTLQIINSAYSQNIFNLTDAGDLTVPGKITVGNGLFWSNGAPYSSGGGSSFTGGIVTSDIYPNANVTVNLGQPSARFFANTYTANVIVSNGIFWANGATFSSGSGDSLNSYVDGGGATTVYYAATDVILDAGASH